MPGFEGDSVSTFQGARYGKDSQYTPRNLMMPASFLMERPAHLALGFRGEDLFMSGRPGVRDSLLWPVIHALIYLFLPDPLSFWSHPLSSVIFPNYFPCGSFLFHSTWPPPTLSIIVFFWESFLNYSPIPWNHSLGLLSCPPSNLPNIL